MELNNPIIFDSHRRKSFTKSARDAIKAFSITERLVFFLFLIIFCFSTVMLLSRINNYFLKIVPDYGGTITEAVIGVPRFANPVLATSDTDKDLTALIFSGLLKATPSGDFINDLSSEYSISDDGRTYTFTLKEDVYFHDGTPVTTDDVEFTIQKIQDPTVKSPKRPIWDGVTIKKIDSRKISFTIKQTYAPFIENFTLGIIPRHLWKNVPTDEFSFSQINVDAIGSGPYRVNKIKKNSYGLPSYYSLKSFKSYALGQPFVKYINLRFYQSETEAINALKSGDVNNMSGISSGSIVGIPSENTQILDSKLPRVFGIFFNQNQAPVFLNKEVRQALSVAINKDRIITDVLSGYGTKINSPISNSSKTLDGDDTLNLRESQTDQALTILTKAGWAINEKTGVMEKKIGSVVTPLSFSIATSDTTELKHAAELIKNDWEKIGASVDLKIFEIGELNQNVIRPRKFDALFFGEIVGREFDLYPFWHSSQRNDPGLNIALYANITADKILENLRQTQSKDERQKKAQDFEVLVSADEPAIFVYAPHFIYVLQKNLENVKVGELTYPGERFLNVHEWYIEKNKVWKIFTN